MTDHPEKTAGSSRDYLIGTDIGTSSSKALAFSPDGRVFCQHQIAYPIDHPRPSFSEQDPAQILEAVTGVIAAVVKQMKRPPLGVSFSAAMHSLMAVDGKGDPLSPLLIWSDGRSGAEAAWLRSQKSAAALYRHTGTPVHPMSPLCKLLWWKKQKTESFKKAARFLDIKGYVFSRFFGEYLIDYSLASATGMFDHTTLKWYAPALALTGMTSARLPAPVSPLEILTGLRDGYASRMGLGADTPFIIGASDGCLANLGTGVTEKGEMAATIGTSGAVRLFTDKPVRDPGQRLFNYLLLEKEFIAGGAINNGGILLDWFRSHFMKEHRAVETYDAFMEEAMRAPAGSDGLLFLPYLLGERSPMWDANARGAYLGMDIKHERKHFMRALLEGICFSLYDSARLLESQDTVKAVYASGGFTRSADWVQMLTDLFAKKVRVCGQGDASSTGAAVLGLRALKAIRSWKEAGKLIPVTRTFSPRKKETAVYRRNFALFSGLYETLSPAMHEIAAWQHRS